MWSLFTGLLTLLIVIGTSGCASKLDYWSQQRRGANFFNDVETAARFRAARAAGIEVVRLSPSKWLAGRAPSERGDFLIGARSGYTGVNQGDVTFLKGVLRDAEQAGLKVVLTLLSLPGARWGQHNEGLEERVLWQSDAWQGQAIRCWQDLARELKDEPAIVGYNVRNEPSPELAAPRLSDWFTGDYAGWYAKVRGTPQDLNRFYRNVVAAIREVDSETPIVLDSGFFATPWAFKVLEPIEGDSKILYSFHMYEPFAFTSRGNKGKHTYPGRVPTGEGDEPLEMTWDRAQVRRFLDLVADWQRRHAIPSKQIFAAELGVFRRNPGAAASLEDVIGEVH